MTISAFRADLHCHTFFSDGADSPEKLFQYALKVGLSALSITDHDTTGAYAEAFLAAETTNITLLPGIEFSAFHLKEPIHVLAYAFPLNSVELQVFCERHQERRRQRNLKMVAKLQSLGIPIFEEELLALPGKTIGRPHLALLLIKKGVVATVREAFQKYLGEGKIAYEPGEKISVEETIACIHKAKGLAILAHPHLIIRERVIRDLLTLPFDGLEGYYAKINPDEEKKWVRLAQKKNWIITGGSDYHGSIKPQNPLGSSWVGKETFEILYNHYTDVTAQSPM